jgi:hypothetical protein
MDLEIPELPLTPMTLQPAPEVLRELGGEAGPPLRERLSLGQPLVLPLSPDEPEMTAEDADLRAFLAAEAERFRYYRVYLACTFAAPDDEPFEQAWLSVRLLGDGGEPPIAWSVAPARVARPSTGNRKFKLGAKAVIAEAGVEVEQAGGLDEVYLEALGLREPTVVWEFSRTTTERIRGSQPLALVARAPAGAGLRGEIELTATIQRSRFLVIRYRAEYETRPTLEFGS